MLFCKTCQLLRFSGFFFGFIVLVLFYRDSKSSNCVNAAPCVEHNCHTTGSGWRLWSGTIAESRYTSNCPNANFKATPKMRRSTTDVINGMSQCPGKALAVTKAANPCCPAANPTWTVFRITGQHVT